MPHTYLPICGGSAVGKVFLIKKLLADEGNLRKRFGIEDGTVDAFGAYFSDGENKRNSVWKEMIHQSEKDVVLFEWQMRDHGFISDLVHSYPNSEHRIIVIWRPWEEHWQGFQDKHPQSVKDGFTIDKLKSNWRNRLKPTLLDAHCELGIPIELVNGATPEYDRMEEWPE